LIAHDEADPWARYSWIGQIDIPSNQPLCTIALRVNETAAGSDIPIEQYVDTFAYNSHMRMAPFPSVLRVSRDCRVHAAIPPAAPISFNRIVVVLVD